MTVTATSDDSLHMTETFKVTIELLNQRVRYLIGRNFNSYTFAEVFCRRNGSRLFDESIGTIQEELNIQQIMERMDTKFYMLRNFLFNPSDYQNFILFFCNRMKYKLFPPATVVCLTSLTNVIIDVLENIFESSFIDVMCSKCISSSPVRMINPQNELEGKSVWFKIDNDSMRKPTTEIKSIVSSLLEEIHCFNDHLEEARSSLDELHNVIINDKIPDDPEWVEMEVVLKTKFRHERTRLIKKMQKFEAKKSFTIMIEYLQALKGHHILTYEEKTFISNVIDSIQSFCIKTYKTTQIINNVSSELDILYRSTQLHHLNENLKDFYSTMATVMFYVENSVMFLKCQHELLSTMKKVKGDILETVNFDELIYRLTRNMLIRIAVLEPKLRLSKIELNRYCEFNENLLTLNTKRKSPVMDEDTKTFTVGLQRLKTANYHIEMALVIFGSKIRKWFSPEKFNTILESGHFLTFFDLLKYIKQEFVDLISLSARYNKRLLVIKELNEAIRYKFPIDVLALLVDFCSEIEDLREAVNIELGGREETWIPYKEEYYKVDIRKPVDLESPTYPHVKSILKSLEYNYDVNRETTLYFSLSRLKFLYSCADTLYLQIINFRNGLLEIHHNKNYEASSQSRYTNIDTLMQLKDVYSLVSTTLNCVKSTNKFIKRLDDIQMWKVHEKLLDERNALRYINGRCGLPLNRFESAINQLLLSANINLYFLSVCYLNVNEAKMQKFLDCDLKCLKQSIEYFLNDSKELVGALKSKKIMEEETKNSALNHITIGIFVDGVHMSDYRKAYLENGNFNGVLGYNSPGILKRSLAELKSLLTYSTSYYKNKVEQFIDKCLVMSIEKTNKESYSYIPSNVSKALIKYQTTLIESYKTKIHNLTTLSVDFKDIAKTWKDSSLLEKMTRDILPDLEEFYFQCDYLSNNIITCCSEPELTWIDLDLINSSSIVTINFCVEKVIAYVSEIISLFCKHFKGLDSSLRSLSQEELQILDNNKRLLEEEIICEPIDTNDFDLNSTIHAVELEVSNESTNAQIDEMIDSDLSLLDTDVFWVNSIHTQSTLSHSLQIAQESLLDLNDLIINALGDLKKVLSISELDFKCNQPTKDIPRDYIVNRIKNYLSKVKSVNTYCTSLLLRIDFEKAEAEENILITPAELINSMNEVPEMLLNLIGNLDLFYHKRDCNPEVSFEFPEYTVLFQVTLPQIIAMILRYLAALGAIATKLT